MEKLGRPVWNIFLFFAILCMFPVINANATENELYLHSLINSGSYYIDVNEDVVLDDHFEIPDSVEIRVNGSLTVPSGRVLYLNCKSTILGSLIVKKGGKVVIGQEIDATDGIVHIDGEYENFTDDGIVATVQFSDGKYSDVHGIAKEDMFMLYHVRTKEELKQALTHLDKNRYNGCWLMISNKTSESIMMPFSWTIPENYEMHIDGTLIIPPDVTLTNNGDILSITSYNNSYLENYGTIVNNTVMKIYDGILVNYGTISNYNNLLIEYIYYPFHDMQPFLENNAEIYNYDTISIEGKIINSGYTYNYGTINIVETDDFIGEWGGNNPTFNDINWPPEPIIPDPIEILPTEYKSEQYIQEQLDAGSATIYLDENIVLEKDFVIFGDVTIYIRHGSIYIPNGMRLLNNAYLIVLGEGTLNIQNGGTLVNNFSLSNLKGTINNNGTIENNKTIFNLGTITCKGTVKTTSLENIQNNGVWDGNQPILVSEGNMHVFLCGDVNHDKKINAKDATLILQSSVGVLKDTTTFCEKCAEVSGDGKLNAKDSTLILQFSVGLRDSFPVAS